MALTLITGPANAAKIGAVLERYEAAVARGDEPLLVVPTVADVEHYQRELAGAGVVLGAAVATYRDLIRELARACDVPGRPLGRVARERVVRAAVRDAGLVALRESAAAPGFAVAAGELFAELQRNLVTPQRLVAALRTWRPEPYTEEIGALYSGYRRRLERLRAIDEEGYAWAALDALRERPLAWGRRPVFFYGFDDLSRAQVDAVETLAERAGAEVVVALSYEAGRQALAGCAGTVLDLAPLASEHVELQPLAEHYATAARAALSHLERAIFEGDATPVTPGDAVRLLEAGGERAEAELVAATVVGLIAGGTAPEDIAVVARGDAGRPLLEQVLAEYGVPITHHRRIAFAQTRLGAGLLAMVRAAGRHGRATDLVTWLRTPGKLAEPAAADRLEAAALRAGATTPQEALSAWRGAAARAARRREEEGPPTDHALAAAVAAELRAATEAARGGGTALLGALVAEAEAVWTAPHERAAAVLDPEDAVDARAAGALRATLAELRGLVAADPRLLAGAAEVLDALDGVKVRERDPVRGVLLADPLEIRARRFRAVVVCGLQDGAFPQRPAPEPFLPDDDRRALALASGLRLPFREDVLARERTLFYACVSRPEETLVLSFRSSTEEGDPVQSSPFVDDVRALFTDELWTERRRRLLADVTWRPAEAPTEHELHRAYAAARDEPDPPGLAAPAAPPVLALLAGREQVTARELEVFAGCGVRWLIEHMLRPQRTEPDSDPMLRGALEHRLLERTLRALRERLGSARLHPGSLDAALACLADAVSDEARPHDGARERSTLRAVHVGLIRVLGFEAESGAGLEPAHLEWSFGSADDEHPPLDLGVIGVRGRVDRIDVGPHGEAIVRDYKRRAGTSARNMASDRRIQVALYALAARDALGVDPVAAVYQGLAEDDLRPRGLVRADVVGDFVGTDLIDPEEFADALDALRVLAVQAGEDLVGGCVRPCPARCTPKGGCAYPAICRAAEGGEEE